MSKITFDYACIVLVLNMDDIFTAGRSATNN